MIEPPAFSFPEVPHERLLSLGGRLEQRLRSVLRVRPWQVRVLAREWRSGRLRSPIAESAFDVPSVGSGEPIVYLPAIPWDYRFQRPQQLALALARAGHPVLYVDGFLRSRCLPPRATRAIHGLLHVLQVRVPGRPDLYREEVSEAAAAEVTKVLIEGIGVRRAKMVLVQLPHWASLGRSMSALLAAPLVYDRIDLHVGFPGVPASVGVREVELIRDADLVSATSTALAEDAHARGARVLRLPNGVDLPAFAELPQPVPRREGPVIGYLGALAEWFDAPALRHAAERRPKWRFRLAGRPETRQVAALGRLANVELTGEVEYRDAAEFLAQLDAVVIPFVDVPLTRAAEPVKLYEALAMGLPVVARRLPETERWRERGVLLYSTPEELVAQLGRAVSGARTSATMQLRRNLVEGETWDRRAADLLAELPRCSPAVGGSRTGTPRLVVLRPVKARFEISKHAPIFIAGHRGLVGSALVRHLEQEGFDSILTAPREELDLRDQEAVDAWFRSHRPEHVVLAAGTVGGILANRSRPADFLYDNLMIHANVLDAARRTGVRRLLYLGSSCIYPRQSPQPIHESSLLGGPLEETNEFYAVAKIAGVKLCQALRRQHGCDFISAMPTNLYGPHDNFDPETSHVLPGLLRRFDEAERQGRPEVVVWGSGKPRREFLHVDDLADACLHLLQHYDDERPINVGSGTDLTIRELAETIREVVAPGVRLVFDPTKPDGPPRKLLELSRLERLGWRSSIELRDGIERTYRWYRMNMAGAAPKAARAGGVTRSMRG